MTYFTPVIDKYLACWLLSDTWYTDQDIEDNFWRFIIALNHYNRPLKNKGRNPRTYDKATLKEKILLAIKRNHPNFDINNADRLVTELCKKAMIVLDALWFVKLGHFPNMHIERMKTLQLK
jgi:hypothetical protein